MKRPAFWKRAATAFARLWALWMVGFLVLTLPPLIDHARNKPPLTNQPSPQKDPLQSPPRSDLRGLQQALQANDNGAILDFFRTRSLNEPDQRFVEKLVAQLRSERFSDRVQAMTELEAIGPRAVPVLRRGRDYDDVEQADRVRQLLKRFDSGNDVALLALAVRRLVKERPVGTVAALLGYLPSAEADALAEEIRLGLIELTPVTQEPDAALTAALTDHSVERRAAAVVVLGRFTQETRRSQVRPLLATADVEVRRLAALAVLSWREKEAVPVLVELLPELSLGDAWATLDLLYQIGGPQAPATTAGVDADGRLRCVTAWRRWWKDHGAGISLKDRLLEIPGRRAGGATLLIHEKALGSLAGSAGIYEANGALEEAISTDPPIVTPVWVQLLPQDRRLLVDYRSGKVIEVEKHGREVWSVKRPWPVYAERLANDHVFIACRNALWEVTRDGESVFQLAWPNRSIVAARRLVDGRILVLTDEGICHWLDREGHELSRFASGCSVVVAAGIDVTANGRVLIPDHGGNRVMEFDQRGEVLWSMQIEKPASVERLPNGNTLIAGRTTRKVQEFNRLGKLVWEMGRVDPTRHPLVARRFIR